MARIGFTGKELREMVRASREDSIRVSFTAAQLRAIAQRLAELDTWDGWEADPDDDQEPPATPS